MASVASQLIEEVTAHAQSDSLEDVREICADGSYFPNNLRIYHGRPAREALKAAIKGSNLDISHALIKENIFSLFDGFLFMFK